MAVMYNNQTDIVSTFSDVPKYASYMTSIAKMETERESERTKADVV